MIVHSDYRAATFASDPGPEPQHYRLDDALDRGYDPHPDDLLPPAAHLALAEDDPWMVALAASVEEARGVRHD